MPEQPQNDPGGGYAPPDDPVLKEKLLAIQNDPRLSTSERAHKLRQIAGPEDIGPMAWKDLHLRQQQTR